MKIIDLKEKAVSNYELGRNIGIKTRDDILSNFKTFEEDMAKKNDKKVEELSDKLGKTFPDYFQELNGIAEGSGIDIKDLLWFSYDTDITGCTNLAIKSNDRIMLGHNEEWDKDVKLYLVKANVANQYRKSNSSFISISYSGQLPGLIGFNKNGISFGGNSIDTNINEAGTPIPFLTRSFLDANSLDEVIEVISKNKREVGMNYLVVSAGEGKMANIEWSPEDYNVIYGDKFIAHTNHFLSEKMKKYQTETTEEYSDMRLKRATGLASKIEIPSFNDFKRILSDHKNEDEDNAICDHESILASVIADSQDNKLYVAEGNGCENEYKEYKLN